MTFNRDWILADDKLYRSGSTIPAVEHHVLIVYGDGRKTHIMLVDTPPIIRHNDLIFIMAPQDTVYPVYYEVNAVDADQINSSLIKAQLRSDLAARQAIARGDL